MIHGTAAAPVGQTLDTHRVVDVEHHHPDTGGPHRPQAADGYSGQPDRLDPIHQMAAGNGQQADSGMADDAGQTRGRPPEQAHINEQQQSGERGQQPAVQRQGGQKQPLQPEPGPGFTLGGALLVRPGAQPAAPPLHLHTGGRGRIADHVGKMILAGQVGAEDEQGFWKVWWHRVGRVHGRLAGEENGRHLTVVRP